MYVMIVQIKASCTVFSEIWADEIEEQLLGSYESFITTSALVKFVYNILPTLSPMLYTFWDGNV
jgi:hypothetical protein